MQYFSKLQVDKISDDDMQNYFYYYKREKAYSYFSVKQVLATILFLYAKMFHLPTSNVLDIKLRKPVYLPEALSTNDISKLMRVKHNMAILC